MILVRINHPYLRVERHTYSLATNPQLAATSSKMDA
jgi:hypothetical protein